MCPRPAQEWQCRVCRRGGLRPSIRLLAGRTTSTPPQTRARGTTRPVASEIESRLRSSRPEPGVPPPPPVVSTPSHQRHRHRELARRTSRVQELARGMARAHDVGRGGTGTRMDGIEYACMEAWRGEGMAGMYAPSCGAGYRLRVRLCERGGIWNCDLTHTHTHTQRERERERERAQTET